MTEEHREEGYVVPKLDVGHGDQQVQPDASEPSPMAAEPKGADAEEEGEAKPTTAPTSPQVEQVEKAEQHVDTAVPKGDDDTPIPPALLPSPADLPHPAEALHRPDSPTTQLISSLRTQLTELADQTQALNAKLVASISRHAELEDQHVQLQDSHKDLQGKAQELEVEKKRWEESMNTGLLVERSQIAGEMQRLASGLVEEERRRGSAEERRAKVENEVDDLAASLFDQVSPLIPVMSQRASGGDVLIGGIGQHDGRGGTHVESSSGISIERDRGEPRSGRSCCEGHAGPLSIAQHVLATTILLRPDGHFGRRVKTAHFTRSVYRVYIVHLASTTIASVEEDE